jgi:hypothetical protein
MRLGGKSHYRVCAVRSSEKEESRISRHPKTLELAVSDNDGLRVLWLLDENAVGNVRIGDCC